MGGRPPSRTWLLDEEALGKRTDAVPILTCSPHKAVRFYLSVYQRISEGEIRNEQT